MAGMQSYVTVGIREDLTDKLIRTGDGEANFLSSLQKRSTVSVTNVKHEWQDWALATPTNNSAVEGFTPATASVARNRRSNYVQIFNKCFGVSDSVLEGTDIAGIKSEYQFQADAAFTGMRRDIEWAILNNTTTGVSGTSAVAATLAGPFGTITTNSSAPAASTSVLTETEFLTPLKQIYTKRGVFLTLDVHAAPRDVMTVMGFTGPGTQGKLQVVNENSTIHNRQVSVIVTNFGKATIVPNNMLAGLGKILYADMQTWSLAVKVPPKLKSLAKTTDSTSAYWKTELTIEHLNESANAWVSGTVTAA
jgi:hypothetical protein